jgi:hypothetical protein
VRAYRNESPAPYDPMYRYDVPALIVRDLPRNMYWNLMNEVRRRPSMDRLTAHWSLKDQM